MVGAVIVTDAVEAMWILVPGMTVHLLMTFLILRTIVRLMGDSDDDEPHSGRAAAA